MTDTCDSPPRGVPGRALHERQLDPEMLQLQRAASASHRRGQIVEAVRNSAAIAIAIGGIIVTIVGHGREASAIVGFAWFLVSAFLLKGVASATARQGALLQERFDIDLFYLPWRRPVAGDPVAEHEVYRLANLLPIGGFRDQRITSGWYDSTTDVHHPYDVLISQEQNLAWDARLRRTYGNWVLGVALGWAALGLLTGIVITSATITQTLLSFFIPSLAAFQLAHEIWSGQHRVASERERLTKIVNDELRGSQPGPVADPEWTRLRDITREIQDGIFRTRLDVSRVPEWFYRHHRRHDEPAFAHTAEEHRRKLTS